jgi:hypothetical protein
LIRTYESLVARESAITPHPARDGKPALSLMQRV